MQRVKESGKANTDKTCIKAIADMEAQISYC
jgi:hypothetical protein